MPGGDRTGPLGAGPRSGRAAGYCSGFNMPGYANPVPGRGYGAGYGRGTGAAGRGFGGGGRGRRNMFYATGRPGWMRSGAFDSYAGYARPFAGPEPETEKIALERQAEARRAELEMIRKRRDEMAGDNTTK